jgi:hypothetical protein
MLISVAVMGETGNTQKIFTEKPLRKRSFQYDAKWQDLRIVLRL